MWLLLLTAININNPHDVPAKVVINVESQQQCITMLESMTYWVKFNSYKITGQCKQK